MTTRTSRTTSRAGSSGRSAPTSTKPLRSSYGAEDGLKQMREEERKAEARREMNKQRAHEPRRFFMKEGETRQYVIIDDHLSFFRHEHNLMNPQSKRWDLFAPCVNEFANCPICKNSDNKPSYFAAYLTIIDLTPFENKDGDEIPWSKRLLVIKPAQQKKFVRLQEREGSLRGMIVEATRDKKTDASIGNDIEFVEFMEEEELLDYETVYVDKDGKEHDIIGHEPFDYEEIFPEWTEKQLIAVAGGRAAPSLGNRDADSRTLNRRGRDEEDEDEGSEERAPRRASRDNSRSGGGSRTSSRAAPSGRSASRRSREEEPEEPEDEAYEEEQEEDRDPPRRGSTRTTSRPARGRDREPEPEEVEDGEEPEDQEPPRRGASRGATSRAPARGSRNHSVEDTLPDDDGRPSRSGGTASRRDQLRRR